LTSPKNLYDDIKRAGKLPRQGLLVALQKGDYIPKEWHKAHYLHLNCPNFTSFGARKPLDFSQEMS
jgi:hypothetical protein